MRGRIVIHAALRRPFEEHGTLLRHFLRLLLAHRAAQEVGAAERVARQHLRNLHHLLLVQDHAVSRREHRLQIRMQVIDRPGRLAVLARDEVIDHAGLERARAEERHERDDVFEAVRLQAPDQILHAAGFQLEHRGRLASLQQLVRRRIVHRQVRHLERRLSVALALRVDDLHRPIDDRERSQPQEVELHETGGLDVVLVELRHDAAPRFVAEERREIRQHRWRDHDAARVHARVAHEPLERPRHVDQRAGFFFVLVAPLQLRLFLERILESDAELERNELRNRIGKAIAQSEHARDVAHDGFRRHRAVRDDLRDALPTVPVGHVFDDAIAPVHAEIDVEVRHGDAFGIEEALEEQVVLQRIEIRDADGIRDERAGARAAARPDGNPVLARPADKVCDDQEVAGESHLTDDPELRLEPPLVFLGRNRTRGLSFRVRGQLRESALEPPLCFLAQKLLRRET